MDQPEQTLVDTTGAITEIQTQDSVVQNIVYTTAEPVGEGIPFAENLFQADWITTVFVIALIVYAVVATFSRYQFTEIVRSFTFRTSAYQATDSQGIFSWQATIANLVSFINLSVFIYFITLLYGDLFPFMYDGWQRWGIILLSFIVFVTIRHIITVITGLISNSMPAFMEYLHKIYVGYRSMGLAIFPVNITISLLYDPPVEILLKTGITIIFFIYIIRIINLLAIFLKNRLPIFYFILYLCALEILPLALLFKLIAG